MAMECGAGVAGMSTHGGYPGESVTSTPEKEQGFRDRCAGVSHEEKATPEKKGGRGGAVAQLTA